MRQLSFLIAALLLALLGLGIVHNADEFSSYLLRDSLILTMIAAVIFAINCRPFTWPAPIQKILPDWTMPETILIGTGIVCGLASFGLSWVNGGFNNGPTISQTAQTTLWWLALATFAVGAFLRARGVRKNARSYRWVEDDLGVRKRVPLDADDMSHLEEEADIPRPQTLLLLMVLMAVGTVLRIWAMSQLPLSCLERECLLLEQLAGQRFWSASEMSLLGITTLALAQLSNLDVQTMRLASLLLGVATLPLLYRFCRERLTATASLTTVALLALNPWHVAASASSEPFITLPLIVTVFGSLMLRAYRSAAVGWWAGAGFAFGWLLSNLEFGRGEVFLWGAMALFAGTGAMRHREIERSFWLLLLFVAGAVTATVPFWNEVLVQEAEVALTLRENLLLLGQNLLWQGEFRQITLHDSSLLGQLVSALMLLGMAVLVRFILRPTSLFALSGLLLLSAAVVRHRQLDASMPSQLLMVLPLVYFCAAVAIDQLVRAFSDVWKGFAKPMSLALAAVGIVLIVLSPATVDALSGFGTVRAEGQRGVDIAMARYVRQQLDEGDGALFFVPHSVLTDPTIQLTMDNLSENPQVQPFNPASDLFAIDEESHDLLYLLPMQSTSTRDLLLQLYPSGQSSAQLDEESGSPLFLTVRIPQVDVTESMGLETSFFVVSSESEAADLVLTNQGLEFFWSEDNPLALPFTALWEGTLLVPEGGRIPFFAEIDGAAAVEMTLDGLPVLDTANETNERSVILARGAYQIRVKVESGEQPGGFAIRWELPGQVSSNIPVTQLRRFMLPNFGLMGSYFAGPNWQGPELVRQKDLQIGIAKPDLDVEMYSVRWLGKLAAPRAGEYMLGGLTEGVVIVRVNGQTVVDSQLEQPMTDGLDGNAELINYYEGVLYLEKGWHDIEINFSPSDQLAQSGGSPLTLFWQPAGGSPGLLPERYLSPLVGEIEPTVLPEAPILEEGWLGDGEFALSIVPPFRDPQVVIGPRLLPPLEPTLQWQRANGCGATMTQFDAPRGLLIDAESGHIYIVDTGNQRVVELTLDGVVSRAFTSPLFEEPFDIDMLIDEVGRTPLVLDAVAQQILRLDRVNADEPVTPLSLTTSFYRPRGLAVDRAGNILVADTGGARAVVVSSDGQMLMEFGGQGTAFGLGQPVDVVVASGRFWGVTAEDGRLWQLNGDVSRSGSVRAPEPANTFDGPHFADLPDGRFFLTDPTRQSILLMESSGQPIARWFDPQLFATPVGIDAAVDGDQLLIAVSDSATCSVSLWQMANVK